VRYHLRDINLSVVAAWSECFAGMSDVAISHGDIFGEPADAIVSPANSFSFMDGGIDLAYSLRFGWFNRTAPRPIDTVLCPGLGTAIGRMHPHACARQMYHAIAHRMRVRGSLPPTSWVHAATSSTLRNDEARGHGIIERWTTALTSRTAVCRPASTLAFAPSRCTRGSRVFSCWP
jgi:hypothetical protein